MRIYTLDSELLIRRTLDEVFAYFEDPTNLEEITPGWLSFRVTSQEPFVMKVDAEVEYEVKYLAFPMLWKSVITEYAPPSGFADEQLHGPFRLWRHRHTFREIAGGVVVGDHVEYALPLGVLGRLAHALWVARQLRGIFEYRQRRLAKIFGGDTEVLCAPVTGTLPA